MAKYEVEVRGRGKSFATEMCTGNDGAITTQGFGSKILPEILPLVGDIIDAIKDGKKMGEVELRLSWRLIGAQGKNDKEV